MPTRLPPRPRTLRWPAPARRPLAPSPLAPRPWWAPSPTGEAPRLRLPRPTPVRGGLRLFLTLARRGRQLSAEVSGGLGYEGAAGTSPITTFTGGWIARLLGYGRKFRGTRLIETFLTMAVRSYLLLYPFAPVALSVKGAVASFGPLWRGLNSPSKQIFLSPLTRSYIWDVPPQPKAGGGGRGAREALLTLFADLGRGAGTPPRGLELDMAAHLVGVGPRARGVARYALTWRQVIFLPTAIPRPRRAKRARGIKKRQAKRLVALAGRRFWA
jgi:hypothetical protein